MSRIATPDEIGLCVINDGLFYGQYARPLCERHALLYTAANIEELRPHLDAEWDLLAEYAADFWRFRLARQVDMQPGRETPELLAGLRAYLRDHYRPEEHGMQARPYGGDLINPVPEWEWGAGLIKPERPYGVLDGADNAQSKGSTVFNALASSAFRGKNSKYSTGPVYVSCSGGPATISTDTDRATFFGRGAVQYFWRWPGMPEAHSAKTYRLAVPIWDCDLNR